MRIFMIRDRKNKAKLVKKIKTCKIYLKMSRFCRALNSTYEVLKRNWYNSRRCFNYLWTLPMRYWNRKNALAIYNHEILWTLPMRYWNNYQKNTQRIIRKLWTLPMRYWNMTLSACFYQYSILWTLPMRYWNQ